MVAGQSGSFPLFVRLTFAGLVLSVVSLMSCGGGFRGPAQLPHAGARLHGTVYGGQQAVVGATIQLYAAGANGYGLAATPLIASTAKTGTYGSFSITGDYECPTPTSQVYLVATGGNPGLMPGTDNSALAMMAALGDCGNLSSATFVYIDEVTTVASVYALAQFMSTSGNSENAPPAGSNLGTSSGNAQGLANAFATVNNLVNTATGEAPGPALPTGATAPAQELNTLADILATCINSDGTSGQCDALFTAATPKGGDAPTNTIDAVLDIALHPEQNVSALYSLVTGTPPFEPTLSKVPNDWTVAVSHGPANSEHVIYFYALAIDGGGNIWTVNNTAENPTQPFLTKRSPTGAVLSPPGGYVGGGLTGGEYTIAVDTQGNVWAAKSGTNDSLSKFSNDGTPLSPSNGYTGGGLDGPTGVAIDGSDDVWTVNSINGSLSKFSNDGTPLSPFDGYTGGGFRGSIEGGIAIDSSGDVWASSESPNAIAEFSNTGMPISPSTGYTGGGLQAPEGLAVDASDNIWDAEGVLCEFSNGGVPLSPSTGYTGVTSAFLAIDGAGNVWSGAYEFSTVGLEISPYAGYYLPGTIGWEGTAIDGSGNVWIVNYGGNEVFEIVGAAAPVMTPLAAAVKNDKLGQRP
jgi:hypothetical protein